MAGKKKLVSTRERARGLILAGKVRISGEVADKPGRLVDDEAHVEVAENLHPYVSRGGVKLEHALTAFGLSLEGKTAVDIGASTGGFTDCLLQHGARKVFAVDVGYGQLDWKLRTDPRVVPLDRKNVRTLTLDDLGEPVDLAVIDVSFISLRLVIPPVLSVLKPEGDLLALVKPQFEVGKDEVEHRGIIKSLDKHLKVLLVLRSFIHERGWVLCGLTPSPITGQKGNREYLIHCVHRPGTEPLGENTVRERVWSDSP